MAAPGDKSFQTGGIAANGSSPYAIAPLGSQLTLEYVAASNTYRVTKGGAPAVSFDAAAGSGSANMMRFDTLGGETLYLLTPNLAGVPLTYTRMATFYSAGGVSNLGVYGVLTKAGDLPKSGSANYSIEFSGLLSKTDSTTYLLGANSAASFTANFGSGTVSTSLTLSGTKLGTNETASFGTIGGTGTIAANGPGFSGNLNGTGAGAPAGTGVFSGAFFGPQAAEVGYAWSFDGTEFDTQGYASGKKN
ncbi:transferrin-binding protein-like solute binding protein [Erythrobacter sp. SG61-1L]|uniref:transferrin-binding protein-like solute binding protein n=1 Tax=Erythrobacter sp. SG61-1L TaxID=1603897 RepID=UPI0012E31FAE|nr:transferrin-binding protein-like solute binding protein [Erythrobacter sp. SG61-1L]